MVLSQDKNDNSLTKLGMSSSEFGQALIDEAIKRRDEERLNKAVAIANTIISAIEECDKQIKYFQGWKTTREGQLDALRKGEFTFNQAGEITYNDTILNRR